MMFSPVKANGNFEFLIFFASKLNIRIAIDVSLISAIIVIIIVGIIVRIVVGVIQMNNVEIIL
jgi:hypothetical protein